MQTRLIDCLDFSIFATPVGKGRPRFNPFGQPYTPAKTRKFESLVKAKAQEAMEGKEPFGQDLKLEVKVDFYYAPPKSWSKKKREHCISEGIPKLTKPDLTNLIKSIEDACNGVIYEDDKGISDLHITKQYGTEDAICVHVKAWSVS